MIEIREDPYNLAPLWRAILDVYTAFADLCERHGLRHYIGFGSAIGVVRHQGFVPWDDDLDVMMPRPDYLKFKELAKNDLPPYLRFVDIYNTPEYRQVFGKVMDTRRDVVANVERDLGYVLAQGIFIDIMPVDGYPEKWIYVKLRQLEDRFLSFKRRMLRNKTSLRNARGWISAVLWSLLRVFYPSLKTDRDFSYYQDYRIQKWPFGSTAKCAPATSIMSQCKTRQVNEYASFRSSVEGLLCGIKVPLAVGYDEILRSQVGDYMQLPSLEKRKPHHYNQPLAPWKFGPSEKNL